MKSYDTLIQEIISKSYSSTPYPSIKKAKKISDPVFLHKLINIIPTVTHAGERSSLYTVIGNYGELTKDLDATIFLINRLNYEKNDWTLYSMLTALGNLPKPKEFDFEPLINLLKKRGQVKEGAIRALMGARDKKVETVLVQLLSKTKNAYNLEYICDTLGSILAKTAVPHLLKLLEHKKADVVSSALNALSLIEKEKALTTYIDQLKNAHYLVKPQAMSSIFSYGDISAIEVVVDRIKRILAKKRKIEPVHMNCLPELVKGLIFLKKHEKNSTSIEKLFDWVLTKKYSNLQKDEANWVNHNLKRK